MRCCGRRMECRSSTRISRWCSSLVSILISISTTLFVFYNILVVVVKSNSTVPSTARPAEHASSPPLNLHANRETYSGPRVEICRLRREGYSANFQQLSMRPFDLKSKGCQQPILWSHLPRPSRRTRNRALGDLTWCVRLSDVGMSYIVIT